MSYKIDFTTQTTLLGQANNADATLNLDDPLLASDFLIIVSGHVSRRRCTTIIPVSQLMTFPNISYGVPCVCYAGSGFVGIKYNSPTSITIQGTPSNTTPGTVTTDALTDVYRCSYINT